MKKKKRMEAPEIMPTQKQDRRLLPHVPDPENIRSAHDRRGAQHFRAEGHSEFSRFSGQRYYAKTRVQVQGRGIVTTQGVSVDLSQTGVLVRLSEEVLAKLECGQQTTLRFHVPPGALQEGMEKRARIRARVVRLDPEEQLCAFEFSEPLYLYFQHKQDRALYLCAVVFLFAAVLFVALLRIESIVYFKFNWPLYLYSIVTALYLLTRYLFGALYRPVPVERAYTPGVTIVIPCFNEETWIRRTILSCIDQEYPIDRLEVIVVDDCSSDHSREAILDTLEELYHESERFQTRERISYIFQEKNAGKREALAAAVRVAKHELVTFVDSDSFLEPDAIRNLVQPFRDPKMGGVCGRTDVANAYTNWLTKMQAVRYYIAFRVMKAAEAYFDSVTCLSGPLSCYRKSIVLECLDGWLGQRFLGRKATFGDDRSLTGMILRHHRTSYQDTAICSTIVPSVQKSFLKQQMRWKRSWLRESLIAGSFIWRKQPFMALFFYIGLLVPIAAPIVVLYNLGYVPLVQRVFPTTFLLGLFLMSMLMSLAQLMLRKSSLWLYGLWFCLYYEGILLWQMPWACLTFWVSTWGTRQTPEDMKADAGRKQKIQNEKEAAEEREQEKQERLRRRMEKRKEKEYRAERGARKGRGARHGA